MNLRYALAIGALYGLLMRILFGLWPLGKDTLHVATGPMLASFVILVPLIIGFYTVYAVRATSPKLWLSITAPWAPTVVFTLGSGLLLIEGSVCIAMALPLFMLMASIGGLSAWIALKFFRPSSATVYSLFALPLLIGAIESNQPMQDRIETTKSEVHINAPPKKIWALINNATNIQPSEMQGGLAYSIGVPFPIEAITHATENGRVRKLRWQKNVKFDEPIVDWKENQYIKWTYHFTPKSFPADALDEHVVIGGKYFDLIDTSYELVPEQAGTKLKIVVNYRVTTNFNWYSATWGSLMVDNASKTILNFYKNRCEKIN